MATMDAAAAVEQPSIGGTVVRVIAWTNVTVLFAFVLNNFLTFWLGMPGALSLWSGAPSGAAIGQAALFAAAIALGVWLALGSQRGLRAEAERISGINTFLIRAAFWAVFLVAVVDSVISFLRIEQWLDDVVGASLASSLERAQFRGTYVHMPLIALGIALAAVTRTLGFVWLALLVVLAQLAIVMGRFVFSYEQAYLSDLVRFWYAGFFLFASAYTLLHEGHVRVDVFYASWRDTTKGAVNVFGTIVFGMAFCWTILLIGMWGKANVINSPILAFEVTQSGYGLYIKYLMAALLAVFGASMLIQFASYLLDSFADSRGLPGKRKVEASEGH